MFKKISMACIALAFAVCSYVSQPQTQHPSQKVFEEEDTYIMFALRAEQLQEYKAAAGMFETLYEKAQKKEYLYRSLQNALVGKEYAYVIERADAALEEKFDDFTLIRFKILAFAAQEKLEEAKELGLKLIEASNEESDYVLVSDIYAKQKKFDTAIKYLESAYAKNYSEEVLDKISIILYMNLQRPKEAIAQLETHTRLHGCSEMICARLIGLYSNENNIDGLLQTYLRLYHTFKSDEAAKNIIQIYAYQKEYAKLSSFLEEYAQDDELLLQMYVRFKKYAQASALALKIYEKTYDVGYLAQSAIFEYEAAQNKNDKKMLAKVVKTLKDALAKEESATYYNYLGYLLIDHSIDVKAGMAYVRKALKEEPQSAYYLDSLAWGYYKLGNCKKAKAILDEVKKLEGGDDPEVLSHIKKVEACLNKTKKDTKKK